MMRHIIPETFVSVEMQLLLFGGSCLMGIPCGMVTDLFRLLRRILPHGKIAVAIEDLFCAAVSAILLAGYMTAFAGGDFRIYYLLGAMIGFVLYECAVSSAFNILYKSIRQICEKFQKTEKNRKKNTKSLASPPRNGV